MPPLTRSDYNRKYYLANKDRIAAKNAENPDLAAYNKKYRNDNKVKQAKAMKEYRQTPAGIRSRVISHWKRKGLTPPIDMTLYELYDNIYFPCTNCMVCKNEFKNSIDKHADHCHDFVDNNFRQVLCRSCNMWDSWKNKI
tara:strand:- start:1251 stop:1670 length:420 start_codon:yes stop_codon:yes gene_type:complete